MTDRILDIEIFGQRYKIRVKGEEDEKYIGHLTSLVDQKMHEVAVKSKSADTTKIAVLAALNIADELFLSQKKLDQGKGSANCLDRLAKRIKNCFKSK